MPTLIPVQGLDRTVLTTDQLNAPGNLEAFQAETSPALVRGFNAGMLGADASSAYADASAAYAAGDKPRGDAALRDAVMFSQKAGLHRPDVGRVEDIRGLGDAISWAAYAAPQGFATSLKPMAGALAGSLLPVGRLRSLASFVGSMIPAYGMEKGEAVQTALADPATGTDPDWQRINAAATGKGLVNAGLESVVPAGIGRALAGGALKGAAAKTLSRAMLEEGLTEGAQEVVGQQTQGLLNPNRDTSGDASDILNAVAAGGVAGGGMHLPGAAADAAFGAIRDTGQGAKKAGTATKDAVVDLTDAGIDKLSSGWADVAPHLDLNNIQQVVSEAPAAVAEAAKAVPPYMRNKAAQAATTAGQVLQSDTPVSGAIDLGGKALKRMTGEVDLGVLNNVEHVVPAEVKAQGPEAVSAFLHEADAKRNAARVSAASAYLNKIVADKKAAPGRRAYAADMLARIQDPDVQQRVFELVAADHEANSKYGKAKEVIDLVGSKLKRKNAQGSGDSTPADSLILDTVSKHLDPDIASRIDLEHFAVNTRDLFTGQLNKTNTARAMASFLSTFGDKAPAVVSEVIDTLNRDGAISDAGTAMSAVQEFMQRRGNAAAVKEQLVADHMSNAGRVFAKQHNLSPKAIASVMDAWMSGRYREDSPADRDAHTEAFKQLFGDRIDTVLAGFQAADHFDADKWHAATTLELGDAEATADQQGAEASADDEPGAADETAFWAKRELDKGTQPTFQLKSKRDALPYYAGNKEELDAALARLAERRPDATHEAVPLSEYEKAGNDLTEIMAKLPPGTDPEKYRVIRSLPVTNHDATGLGPNDLETLHGKAQKYYRGSKERSKAVQSADHGSLFFQKAKEVGGKKVPDGDAAWHFRTSDLRYWAEQKIGDQLEGVTGDERAMRLLSHAVAELAVHPLVGGKPFVMSSEGAREALWNADTLNPNLLLRNSKAGPRRTGDVLAEKKKKAERSAKGQKKAAQPVKKEVVEDLVATVSTAPLVDAERAMMRARWAAMADGVAGGLTLRRMALLRDKYGDIGNWKKNLPLAAVQHYEDNIKGTKGAAEQRMALNAEWRKQITDPEKLELYSHLFDSEGYTRLTPQAQELTKALPQLERILEARRRDAAPNRTTTTTSGEQIDEDTGEIVKTLKSSTTTSAGTQRLSFDEQTDAGTGETVKTLKSSMTPSAGTQSLSFDEWGNSEAAGMTDQTEGLGIRDDDAAHFEEVRNRTGDAGLHREKALAAGKITEDTVFTKPTTAAEVRSNYESQPLATALAAVDRLYRTDQPASNYDVMQAELRALQALTFSRSASIKRRAIARLATIMPKVLGAHLDVVRDLQGHPSSILSDAAKARLESAPVPLPKQVDQFNAKARRWFSNMAEKIGTSQHPDRTALLKDLFAARELARSGKLDDARAKAREIMDRFNGERKNEQTREENTKNLSADEIADIKRYLNDTLGLTPEFADMLHSGEWAPNLVRIAMAPKAGGMGAARHEAMHEFMHRLMTAGRAELAGILMSAANSTTVLNQLHKLLAGDKAALAQLNDPQERLAYMYQFWGEGRLRVGPETKGVFTKIADFFRLLSGRLTESQHAERIMKRFEQGNLRDMDTSELDKLENPSGAYDKFLASLDPLFDKAERALSSSDSVLRSSGNPALVEVAKLIYNDVSDEGGKLGYLQALKMRGNQFRAKLEAAFGDADEATLELARDALMTGKDSSLPAANAVRDSVRALMDEFHEYMKGAGVEIGYLKDYYPRVWDSENVAANKDAFVNDLLTLHPKDMERLTYGVNMAQREQWERDVALATKLGKSQMPERPADLTPEELAKNITESIASGNGKTAIQIDGENAAGVVNDDYSPWFANIGSRVLHFIDKEHFAKYQSMNMAGTLESYLTAGVKRAEHTRSFGHSYDPQTGKKVDDTLTLKLRQAVDYELAQVAAGEKKIEEAQRDVELYRDAIHAQMGVLGVGKISPAVLKFNQWMTTYQNYRTLPLAVFSQVIDPMGIVVRGGDFSHAWAAYKRGLVALFNQYTGKKGAKDDAERLAELCGTVAGAALDDVIAEGNGADAQHGLARRLSDALFKWNGMQAWDRSLRIQATAAAVDFLKKQVQNPDDLSDRYLRELGLTPADVKIKADGSLDVSDPKMQEAIFRFVYESILQPNAAQRPIYGNDPRFALVYHLKQFAFAFNKVLLARAHREMQHGNLAPMAGLAASVPAIIASDFMRDMITHGGQLSPEKQSWGLDDWIGNGVRRAGLLATGEFMLDATEHGAMSLAGPFPQQVTSALSQPIGETVTDALPLNALYRNAL